VYRRRNRKLDSGKMQLEASRSIAWSELIEIVEVYTELECGPMPNVMVALPNIGGALCSTPQNLAEAHY